MRRWNTLAACCLGFVAGCAPTRSPETPVGPHVRVFTYNINWGLVRPELGLKAIEESDADVVLLQESNRGWEAYLRPLLATRYPHMVFRNEPAAGGMAVLARAPIKEIAYTMPAVPGGWFHGWIVQVDTPIGPVQFLNVHLRPALSDQGTASLSALHATGRVRRSEVESHFAKLTPGVPTIVAGDFNESDDGDALRFLETQAFTNALPQFDRLGHTWHWPVGLLTLRGRYDHILHSPHLRCFDARILREGASDHFGVTAVLAPNGN